MKKRYLLFLILLPFQLIFAQSSFSLDEYQQFLQSNENMTTEQLLNVNNAGKFSESISSDWETALFHDSIQYKYKITEGEKSLIKQNGFVVSERLSEGSFGHQFENIYHKDLPVFISSDAILHAFHASYNKILKQTELYILIDKLNTLLENLQNSMGRLEARHSQEIGLDQMLNDLDVYLTVPKRLLTGNAQPYYNKNNSLIDSLIIEIESYNFVTRAIFS